MMIHSWNSILLANEYYVAAFADFDKLEALVHKINHADTLLVVPVT